MMYDELWFVYIVTGGYHTLRNLEHFWPYRNLSQVTEHETNKQMIKSWHLGL